MRGLIVVVLVIGVGLGWIVREAHIQRDAVAAIKKAGGVVRYDWEWRDGNSIPGGEPWAPRWLTDRIGVDYFGRVTRVELISVPSATNTTLAHVGRLTRLQELSVESPSVTDAGLEHMKALTELSNLRLRCTHVTDAGLERLKGLTKLSVLDLSDAQVTDAGLVHLKGLTNLSQLYLFGTRVSDAGLTQLKGLTKLQWLNLQITRATHAGMNDLEKTLPSLTIIR
jgi:Leucine-rich repeat (LRR) protein